MGNDDILRYIDLLEKERNQAEQLVVRLDNAIAALRAPVQIEAGPTTGASPAIEDICRYLKQAGKPVHQNEIIQNVAQARQERYPSLRLVHSNVWRALEYHIRTNKRICCIDPLTGRMAKLRKLPKHPAMRQVPDEASFYLQENWFVLKEDVVEGRYVVKDGRTSEVAGLD